MFIEKIQRTSSVSLARPLPLVRLSATFLEPEVVRNLISRQILLPHGNKRLLRRD